MAPETGSTNEGSALQYLPDLSGNNHHFRVVAGANAALFTNDSSGFLNDKPHLWFDGSNDYYTNLTYTAEAANYTWFAVIKQEKFSDFALRTVYSLGTDIEIATVDPSSSPDSYSFAVTDRSAKTSGTRLESVAHVLSVVMDNATSLRLYTNGVLAGTGTFTQPSTTTFTSKISDALGGSANYKQALAEMFMYKAALSTGNRQSAEDYLGTKYGITITH